MLSSFYSEFCLATKYHVSSIPPFPVRFPKRKGKNNTWKRRANKLQENARTARPAKHNILPYMQIEYGNCAIIQIYDTKVAIFDYGRKSLALRSTDGTKIFDNNLQRVTLDGSLFNTCNLLVK